MTYAIRTVSTTRADPDVLRFHERVHPLCAEKLREAWNPFSGLFDRQLRQRVWANTIGTEDITSTAIALIALHRTRLDPTPTTFDAERAIIAMAQRIIRHPYPGAYGLLLWANAIWQCMPFESLCRRARFSPFWEVRGPSALTTMELSWLVSGASHALRDEAVDPNAYAEGVAQQARDALLERFHPKSQLFSHADRAAPWQHRTRRWLSNFADQVYAVQALSFRALSRNDDECLRVAGACATRLAELQGELGQWWWHYHTREGRVAQGFPVYSVHQHAMAPMALMTLEHAGGPDLRRAISLSHRWIHRNELAADLLDVSAGTVWRDVELQESLPMRWWRHARDVTRGTAPEAPKPPTTGSLRLRINHETRPYEWAWCLYAGAIAAGDECLPHLV